MPRPFRVLIPVGLPEGLQITVGSHCAQFFQEGLQGVTVRPQRGHGQAPQILAPGPKLPLDLASSGSSILRQSCVPAAQHVLPAHRPARSLPCLQAPLPLTLFRSLPGTTVASIQAMHTGGSSGRITYSIISGNEKNAFLIQPSSGTALRPPGEAAVGARCALPQGSEAPPSHRNTVHTSMPVK